MLTVLGTMWDKESLVIPNKLHPISFTYIEHAITLIHFAARYYQFL